MDPGRVVVDLCSQLFGACVQGYDIFSNARNFDTDYGDFCWNLDTERGRLVKWVEAWGISGEGGLHRKLNPEDWEYRYAIGTLARISALFANLNNLDSKYGVQVDMGAQQCSRPGDSRVAESRTSRRLQISRWTKSFLTHIKKQSDSLEESRDTVTHSQQASTSDFPSHMMDSPAPTPSININFIAQLENPARIEMKVPLPSLTDDINRLSNATSELHKIFPTYKKFRWAISDKEKSEKLIRQLTKYNDGLYDIVPPKNLVASSVESRSLSLVRGGYFTVPHNSTSIFTGRSDILDQIHKHFSHKASPNAAPLTRQQRRFVLFGMGGSGKTQIALKFAEDHRDSFWAILWIDATSRETAEKGFCDIARIAKVEENLKAAKQWLASLEEEWLLIIDNADDPELDISEYFPSGNRGNILLTTRNPDCWKYGPESHHEIREMEENEAVSLLLKASKNVSNRSALQWASPIVKELGFLALAIDQAGAYIANSCEISQYLDIYKQHRKELLLRRSVQGAGNYKRTVYTTWEVAFRRVEEENPIAANILKLFAFLHHEGISEEIFQRASASLPEISNLYSATEIPEWFVGILRKDNSKNWDPFHFRNDVEILLRYSLIRKETNVYSVHPLVHSWARDRLQNQEQQSFGRFAVLLLSLSITWKFKLEDYAFRRQLLPHIDASRMHSANPLIYCEADSEKVIHSAKNIGLVYSEMGRWKEAEENQERAVEASEKIFGNDHPETLLSMTNLAVTYRNQGRWNVAEKIQERVVEVRKRILGNEHPDTVYSMAILALTYKNQGRWKEAEKIQERVVDVRKKILGNEHPDTLDSMTGLASTYWNQGRWKESEKLGECVVEAKKRVLGNEHPETLVSMANLAMAYKRVGRMEEAEKMEQRVIEARERILGNEHPETLRSKSNLAFTYKGQGRYVEAEKIEERVLETKERALGHEHPSTLTSLNNLVGMYNRQGRWKEAEMLGERVLEAGGRILGNDHPRTLNSMRNLAETYRNLGRLEEAKQLEECTRRRKEFRAKTPQYFNSSGKPFLDVPNPGPVKETKEI